MEEHSTTSALQEFPQLSLLHFLSPQNQGVIKNYLVYIRARRYGPAMQEGTIRTLKSFALLMPEARQVTLVHDLTPDSYPQRHESRSEEEKGQNF
jgi:hypothetical protein